MSRNKSRIKIEINGIVQGVGFRPFIHTLANMHKITGFVSNTSQGVTIEAEGRQEFLDGFLADINRMPPPLVVITQLATKPITLQHDTAFIIRASAAHGKTATLISPDISVCNDCLNELFDPKDRRYLYPFINCTNCGPRYTIIDNIPYDRPCTSMRHFTMCTACQAEYDDPHNRRFHAQPNCCPDCGPQVTLYSRDRTALANRNDAVHKTIRLLQNGHIVAIKGLGGFHLVVDAANEVAVKNLRLKKKREEKPLAVMVPNLESARSICILSQEEESVLSTPQCPILLVDKRQGHNLAPSVAPGCKEFGVMLPYTPLHHLLWQGGFKALVMTSGNVREEPICISNEEAFAHLFDIADFYLAHNRNIYLRNDDSIVARMAGDSRLIRRARGYAPMPLFIKNRGPTVLGVGALLKNTVCLLKDDKGYLSQHIGDLENLAAYGFFQKTISHLKRIFTVEPELIVHDLHPGYLSTRWAKEQKDIPLLGVQHHHAHLAACLAENRASGPIIGLMMDGTGYGTDNTIWGGEILIGDFETLDRFASFEPMPLPGGDAAIREPWRTALAYLYETFGPNLPPLPFLAGHDIDPILAMLGKNINCPKTSSCGRLFDAVAAMSGGKQVIRYEAQAAIEFMHAAGEVGGNPFSYQIIEQNSCCQLAIRPIIRSVVEALLAGQSLAVISQRLHRTLIDFLTAAAIHARTHSGLKVVALSGGVFQNRLLFNGLLHSLAKEGFTVLTHSLVPTNDGCISLGQAMIGRYSMNG